MTMLQTIGGVILALASLLGAIAAYRKFGPEARQIEVKIVDTNVTIADRLRDGAVADWERIRGELDDLTTEFRQYRLDTEGRLAEMSAELRAERAEKEHVKQENERLRDRVKALETEVASLKVNGHGPHS
jgi:gas vesicle protein